jgi:hypothetical protein
MNGDGSLISKNIVFIFGHTRKFVQRCQAYFLFEIFKPSPHIHFILIIKPELKWMAGTGGRFVKFRKQRSQPRTHRLYFQRIVHFLDDSLKIYSVAKVDSFFLIFYKVAINLVSPLLVKSIYILGISV